MDIRLLSISQMSRSETRRDLRSAVARKCLLKNEGQCSAWNFVKEKREVYPEIGIFESVSRSLLALFGGWGSFFLYMIKPSFWGGRIRGALL